MSEQTVGGAAARSAGSTGIPVSPGSPAASGERRARPPRAPIRHVDVIVLAFDAPPGLLERSVDAAIGASDRLRGGATVEVVVVDNGGSARRRLAGAGVEVVETGTNAGYGAGMNVGIRRALARGADAVAVLNDDVVVEPGWLDPLIAALDADADLASAQPTLLFERRPNDARTSAGDDVGDGHGGGGAAGPIVNSTGVVLDRAGAGADRDRGVAADQLDAEPTDVSAFTGGAVVLHRDFLDDVGLFDERFFLYYEDVELARRGARRGWRHRWVPASRVWHTGSATTERLGEQVRWMQERNRLWSTAMHGSAAELARGLWLSVRRLRHEPRAVHRRALLHGLAGIPNRVIARWWAGVVGRVRQ